MPMSAKFSSPHFYGTNGSTKEALAEIFGFLDEPTATVWAHIHPTQPNYPGTQIPRSFVIDTEHGSFWTHGNATKHMNEAVTALKGSLMMTNTNPNLLSQFVLYDYRKALNKVTSQDVKLGHMYESDHWSIMFRKKKGDANTVVVHALFKGFK